MDFPYDNSLVFLHESCIKGNTCVEIQLCGDTEIDIVAEYSTEEKAVKAMEMLREAYNNNEFYHCTATTNTFQESIGLLSNEKIKEVTSEYFRFPQDDEIEV
jgi:hypothetical protein